MAAILIFTSIFLTVQDRVISNQPMQKGMKLK